jgi:hypothetical protein
MPGIYEQDLPIKTQEVGTTIYNLKSAATPLTRLLKTGPQLNEELSSWEVETYPDDSHAGTLDGTDKATLTDYGHTDREKVEAHAQYMQSPGWHVSRRASRTMTPATKRNEKAHQAMRDAERFALMIEKRIGSDVDTRGESGGTASSIRGMFSWLSATAQSNKPVPAAFRPPSAAVFTAALSTLTPTTFEAMLAALSAQINSSVDLLMPCGLTLKRAMSLWLERDTSASATDKAIAQYSLSKSDKKLIQVCNRFEFDSGIVTNMTHFHLLTDSNGAVTDYSTRSGLLLNLSMWDIAYLSKPTHYENPDLGGGPRGYHDVDFILRCRNPQGQGMIKTNS